LAIAATLVIDRRHPRHPELVEGQPQSTCRYVTVSDNERRSWLSLDKLGMTAFSANR
jgi:hypothetical protein